MSLLDVANITENEQKVVELITVEVWDQINNIAKSDPKEKLSVEVSPSFLKFICLICTFSFRFASFEASRRSFEQGTAKSDSQHY